MVGKREAKREALKSRLMKAATTIIVENGVRGLNARAVTTKADCALGSLYTAYDDIDDLIVHVNSQTLSQLGEALIAEINPADHPVAILKALAMGYVKFASDNFPLWNALFEYADLTMLDIPEWHQQEQAMLVNFIKQPVMALSPDIPEEEAMTRARTLFAAVHGIVVFSLQSRYIGLNREDLESELIRFIDQMVAGLGK